MKTYRDIIQEWKLNKVVLSQKVGMNAWTFKMKLAGNDPRYHFTDQEEKRLKEALHKLKNDISLL